MQKHYFSKKDVKFPPPPPPSAELYQNIVSDFCVDTSSEVFEEAGCAVCGKLTPICEMEEPINFKSVPNVLVFKINSRNIKVSKTLKFEQKDETVTIGVRGLIYHGDFHFTSRIIGTDGIVWYHDGMTTGSGCENEGDFDKFSSKSMLKCKGKKLILVVYARVMSP